jgi:hypothetical protein
MTTPNNLISKTHKRPDDNLIRKPYEKPTITYRELMESIAGPCEPGDPVNGKTGSGDNCTVIGS